MTPQPHALDINLEPADNRRLANLCGQFDEHLRQVERRLGVEINNRGNHFRVIGDAGPVQAASELLKSLYATTSEQELDPQSIHLRLQDSELEALVDEREAPGADVAVHTKRGVIRGRGPAQQRYLLDMQRSDLSFGIGPAGTGKTYLAVASAVDALERDEVRRLILVRPAVEAGERLGFLPGDMAQKVDPYLRPMYDALYEMMGFERVGRLIERHVIEVAPLAFMRGRTLNESFIILDEAQNTSVEQMKMFLTRIGFGSRAVVTGDVTQIDLPRNQKSGLRHAVEVLKDIPDVSFTFFTAKDVVRHPLVQKIVSAYEQHSDSARED
ncbi:PhoH family protein [Natronospira bacteriovora]|uniref:PhoH-like protein n=1 Tax=Natronospira bacteriovora TaxID=3069753 RepID=A0ABU0W6N0_9GAMM|nr:PhoH family protein [Natronospira sp. AB-CW4]MDQ2069664.1 PhoH family protein [Natronospira sp. AB-CW4]